MRSVAESRERWKRLFGSDATALDLRQALKSQDEGSPCEFGLRSICWKAFLLFDNVDPAAWPQKISDSRSAYASVRDHFLKYIEYPDHIPSTVDPLTEDEESPWQSLRKDETLRSEIFQDVERCLQENPFFREPETKTKLLDILFIYSKLNPDLGYRQGMHELLAPVLLVISRDAIQADNGCDPNNRRDADDLMLQALDAQYIEHDAFTLFCAIMQTARVFYEHETTKFAVEGIPQETAPIVRRSLHVHENVLGVVDPELAEYLQAIEVLPQIFLTRWIRLLFGREFPFEDVLSMWDLLFAENLRLALIDSTCVAMLLRIRWQLLDADYSSALTMLLRYPSPQPLKPESFIRDGLRIERKLSPELGASIVSKYSGKTPSPGKVFRIPRLVSPVVTPRSGQSQRVSSSRASGFGSPGSSPARLPQRGLESLFQDVSDGLQRRTETWGVAKAVRGAMEEARRNIQNIQSNTSPRGPNQNLRESPAFQPSSPKSRQSETRELKERIDGLEKRNKALAKMLGTALEDLRANEGYKKKSHDDGSDQALNFALARVQFVQVYLEDSTMPIPDEDLNGSKAKSTKSEPAPSATTKKNMQDNVSSVPSESSTPSVPGKAEERPAERPTEEKHGRRDAKSIPKSVSPPNTSSLTESSFAWMLGEDRHRSIFASPASAPPELKRSLDQKARPTHLFGDDGEETGELDDGPFALSSLRGSQRRR